MASRSAVCGSSQFEGHLDKLESRRDLLPRHNGASYPDALPSVSEAPQLTGSGWVHQTLYTQHRSSAGASHRLLDEHLEQPPSHGQRSRSVCIASLPWLARAVRVYWTTNTQTRPKSAGGHGSTNKSYQAALRGCDAKPCVGANPYHTSYVLHELLRRHAKPSVYLSTHRDL